MAWHIHSRPPFALLARLVSRAQKSALMSHLPGEMRRVGVDMYLCLWIGTRNGLSVGYMRRGLEWTGLDWTGLDWMGR
jgi:hypothetical protein